MLEAVAAVGKELTAIKAELREYRITHAGVPATEERIYDAITKIRCDGRGKPIAQVMHNMNCWDCCYKTIAILVIAGIAAIIVLAIGAIRVK
jgi:1,6-anhydro-N-acetylmuramate kinase